MKTINTLLLAGLVSLPLLPLLGGCGGGAKVIEQNQSITTVEQIDIQDFRAATAALTRQMLESPRVAAEIARIRAAGQTAPLVKISHIKNDTMLKVDMRGFLVDPMEAELLKSGSFDFFAEDSEAQQIAKMNEIRTGAQPRVPDLILYGTVRDLRSEAGDVKQASYVFNLKLANASGSTIWQDEKLITKQGKRPAVGI